MFYVPKPHLVKQLTFSIQFSHLYAIHIDKQTMLLVQNFKDNNIINQLIQAVPLVFSY